MSATDDYAAGRVVNRGEVITSTADRAMLEHRYAEQQLRIVATRLDTLADTSRASPDKVAKLRAAARLATEAADANKKADDEWKFWGKARADAKTGQRV